MSAVPACDPEAVQGETEAVDFKAQFDPTSRQDWCELVKDLVAIANSGGGSLIFGVQDDGTPSGTDVRPVLQLDPADVTNKIHSYTEQQFSGFEIRGGVRRGHPVALLSIAGVRLPMVFTAPGTYSTSPSVQKTAFSRGTVYFRHGAQQIVQESVRAVDQQVERVQRLDAELAEHVPSWRLYRVVQALQALRGVQDTVAITMVAEIGDLTRFDNPRQLAAFLGLIPSEYSSGDSRRQGSITKAGNGHARRALIEGDWAYRFPAKVSAHIQKRLENLPKPIQDIGWKAQVRLCKRYRRLTARGKHPNVAVTAVARELAAFMWAIAREVPITA